MRFSLTFCLTILVCNPSWAREPGPRIIITPLSAQYPNCCFPKDKYIVAPARGPDIVTSVQRDEWLAQAGLRQETAKWRHLEKTMLYKRAIASEEEAYLAKYPEISKEKLRMLKKILLSKGIRP